MCNTKFDVDPGYVFGLREMKTVVQVILGMLMTHIMMITDTFSTEVPPEFIGVWRGQLNKRQVFTTIFGGKVNSIVGMSVNMDDGQNHGRQLKFVIEGENGKKSTVNKRVLFVEGLPYTKSSKAKFKYSIAGDLLAVAETYFNNDGEIIGEASVALSRADGGFVAETHKTCKPKRIPLSPKARLQAKLACLNANSNG